MSTSEKPSRVAVITGASSGIRAATAGFPGVDANRIGALGICGGGGYTLNAVKSDKRFRSVATVSMFNSGRVRRDGLQDSALDTIQDRLLQASQARAQEAARGEILYAGDAELTDEEMAAQPFPLMTDFTVLVVGATGSIGRRVVTESLRRGHRTRALVRDAGRAATTLAHAEIVVGDLTSAANLATAVDGVDGIDGIVFTHGSHGGGADAAEQVDYGAVPNVLEVLRPRRARIALMTAIGVTKHTTGHDWKRRGERLVRASGLPYTIVRPGWFDYSDPDQQQLVMMQGDRRWAGDPSDGVVSRAQIAQTLVASLTSSAADHRTLELVAERGAAQDDLDPLFQALQPDPSGSLDGLLDRANMPLDQEPPSVVAELRSIAPRPTE